MLFSETLPFNPQKLIFRYLEIIPFHFLVNSSKEPDIDFEPFLVELSLKKKLLQMISEIHQHTVGPSTIAHSVGVLFLQIHLPWNKQ